MPNQPWRGRRCWQALLLLVAMTTVLVPSGCARRGTSPAPVSPPSAGPAPAPPRLESSYPADMAADIPVDATMKIVFSAPMDTASVKAGVSMSPSVPGSIEEYGEQGYVFRPKIVLQPNTAYRLVIPASVRDRNGTALGKEIIIRFFTRHSSPVRLGKPQWSPDGEAIYIIRDDAKGNRSLWYVAVGDGQARLVADGLAPGSGAALSPGGKLLVAAFRREGKGIESADLWLIDGSGKRIRRLIDGSQYGWPMSFEATWSPDGRWLAVAAGYGGVDSHSDLIREVSIIGVDGRNLRKLEAPGSKYILGWTRKGSLQFLATHGGQNHSHHFVYDVYEASQDGTTRLVDESGPVTNFGRAAQSADLSAVAAEIWEAVDTGTALPHLPAGIVVLQPGKGGAVPVVTGDVRDPDLDKDGSRLVYASGETGDLEIWLKEIGGESPRRLTAHAGADYKPAWSPDGRQVAYVSYRLGREELRVIDADGSGDRLVWRE